MIAQIFEMFSVFKASSKAKYWKMLQMKTSKLQNVQQWNTLPIKRAVFSFRKLKMRCIYVLQHAWAEFIKFVLSEKFSSQILLVRKEKYLKV